MFKDNQLLHGHSKVLQVGVVCVNSPFDCLKSVASDTVKFTVNVICNLRPVTLGEKHKYSISYAEKTGEILGVRCLQQRSP